MREYRFVVSPYEDLFDRMDRWDAELRKLQAEGLTIRGTGPDGDEPIRFEMVDPLDITGAYFEFYEVVSL